MWVASKWLFKFENVLLLSADPVCRKPQTILIDKKIKDHAWAECYPVMTGDHHCPYTNDRRPLHIAPTLVIEDYIPTRVKTKIVERYVRQTTELRTYTSMLQNCWDWNNVQWRMKSILCVRDNFLTMWPKVSSVMLLCKPAERNNNQALRCCGNHLWYEIFYFQIRSWWGSICVRYYETRDSFEGLTGFLNILHITIMWPGIPPPNKLIGNLDNQDSALHGQDL